MNNIKTTPLLISLKPNYADLIFSGLKTAELRRRISEGIQDRDVYVYVSSPVKELRGGFRVGQVWAGSPSQIWATVRELAGVNKRTFDNYYSGQKIAFALEILDVWEYAHPRSLEQLRARFLGFVAPQSYRYVRAEEIRSFRALKRIRLPRNELVAI
ncbi:MAG: ASCH domain-containing protein [Verrucomicrobia bacterium]|jgi:predicted transcriptional regulator|nr:ASCH domain-containing protein [Verrucomicrobiota bacterium]